jgi:NAD(P)-dependent dehydrogenase (short-subunit alcohol dehydrogenase family)
MYLFGQGHDKLLLTQRHFSVKEKTVSKSRGQMTGKTVLITGGARGIGAATARALGERGASLALIDLHEDELAAVAQELGPRAAAFPADVTDTDAMEAAIEAVVAQFGGIDVIVANAGVAYLEPVASGELESFRRTVDVNLVGVWNTIRLALPHVIGRRGYVLSVASIAAAIHPTLHGAYAASKAGVEALTDVLRTELADTDVAVGVAYFPYIDTPMVRDALGSPIGQDLWTRLTFPLNRLIPVDRAATAMVTGIERRARRVYTPRWVRAVLLLRGVLPRLVDRQMRRIGAHEVVARYERETAPDLARSGRG